MHGDFGYSLGLDANKEGLARFVTKGVPLDALDNKVDTALHIVGKGFRAQLRLDLIEMGANPFIVDTVAWDLTRIHKGVRC